MKKRSESKKKEKLLNTIQTLYKQQERSNEHLDECLLLYYEKVAPRERELLELLVERTKIYVLLFKKISIFLTFEQRAKLEGLLLREIQALLPHASLPVELTSLYEELTRPKMPRPTEGRILDHVEKPLQKQHRAQDSPEEHDLSHKPTPSKERKKDLNRLYKRLVKALHPDLEPDEEKRELKEEVMKRVIRVYEENDLYQLMEIEKEQKDILPDEEEKEDDWVDYCVVLEEKVEALHKQIQDLYRSPKYSPLHRFGPQQSLEPSLLFQEQKRMKESIKAVRSLIDQLQGPDAEAILMKLLEY